MPVPQITGFSVVPNRQTDSAAEFSSNATTFVDEQANQFAPEANTLAIAVNGYADAAAASAASAATFGDYRGDWSALTGSVPISATVSHNALLWLADVAIADVTTEEPSVSSDWVLISFGTDPLPAYAESGFDITGSGTISLNLSLANEFRVTLNAAGPHTINFTGLLPDGVESFTVRVINGVTNGTVSFDADVTKVRDAALSVDSDEQEFGFKVYAGESTFTGYNIGVII